MSIDGQQDMDRDIDTDHNSSLVDAPKPFGGDSVPNADAILRSSDLVDFHVHKLVLSIASPFFQSMFTLPQSQIDAATATEGLPIIPVAESASTLMVLLLACYPGSIPKISSVDELRLALHAAHKYEMSFFDSLSDVGTIIDAVKANPLVIYTTACRLGLQRISDISVREILKQTSCLDRRAGELRDVSGLQYYDLLQYHRDCCAAAVRVTWSTTWFKGIDGLLARDLPYSCPKCWTWGAEAVWRAPEWLWTYLSRARSVLEKEPSGEAVARVSAPFEPPKCHHHENHYQSYAGLGEFSRLLAAEVERVVLEVSS